MIMGIMNIYQFSNDISTGKPFIFGQLEFVNRQSFCLAFFIWWDETKRAYIYK